MTTITPHLKSNNHICANGRKKLRIAIVGVHACPFRPTGELNSGGMNVYLKEMTRHIAQVADHIDIFTFSHPMSLPPVHNILPNLRIVHLPGAPQHPTKNELYDYLPTFTQAMLDFTRNQHYDIVYSHYWLSTIPAAALAGANTPHIVSFHTLNQIKQHYLSSTNEHPLRTTIEAQAARSATSIIAWSEHEKEALIQLYDVKPQKIQIIPPGVDTNLFTPTTRTTARAQLGIKNELIISYIGRLEAIKGIPTLIDAFAKIKTAQPHKLHIIGAGQNQAETALIAKQLNAKLPQNAFKLWGSIKHDKLPLHYAASDIFATTSYYESFGIAALEATASGIPIVASNVGGLKTVVIDKYNGFLADPHQQDQYTAYFEKLLADQKLRQKLGDNGRRHSQNFKWQKIINALNEHFHSVSSNQIVSCSATT